MRKFHEAYGAVVVFGGSLLLHFGALSCLMGPLTLHCVPGWVHDHWWATVGLLIAAGLASVLAGLCVMADDRRYMAAAALLAVASVIPTYGIQYSINEAVTNCDMAGPFLLAIISIAVLAMAYPLHRGLGPGLDMRHWAALLSIAGALVVFGFLMLPMSFNIVVGHEEGQTVREVVYTMSCAAAAYLSLAGIVTGYFLRRTGQGARQRNL